MTEIGLLEYELKSKNREMSHNNINQNPNHDLTYNFDHHRCPYSNNISAVVVKSAPIELKNCPMSNNSKLIPPFSSDEV